MHGCLLLGRGCGSGRDLLEAGVRLPQSRPPGYEPGPHATWDCPHRYIQRYGYCPGFNPDGTKDQAQWLPDNILTRAAKDRWLNV